MSELDWLSDKAWAVLEPHLPKNRLGAPRVDDLRVTSGILHVLRSGSRWKDYPPKYRPATRIYNRYNWWSAQGLWHKLFARLAAARNIPDELSIDSTHIKAYRSAAGSKRGTRRRRSAGNVADGPARSTLWPTLNASRLPSSRLQATSPTTVLPRSCSTRSRCLSACWPTKPTTRTTCASGSRRSARRS